MFMIIKDRGMEDEQKISCYYAADGNDSGTDGRTD